MNLIDLSHFIEPGMPVYPGTEPPEIRQANTLETDGFREKRICMYSHTGTHMDAPAHILPGTDSLDSLALDRFTGRALVLDVSDRAGGTVGIDVLHPWMDALDNSDYLLLRSRWDRFWGEDAYFRGYPVLSEEAARWLAGLDLQGIGLDTISADPADDTELRVHRILLGAGMVIVENLTGLEKLPAGESRGLRFMAMPLKIRDADGSPVRAAAFLQD